MHTLLLGILLSAASTPVPSSSVVGDAQIYFKPLPAEFVDAANPLTDEKIALGRMLYFDKRLSKNHDVACNSCHGLDKYGIDGEPTSAGHRKQRGSRNSPTVYNAGAHLAQFWDGRAGTLEEQAKGPILNPVEMAHPSAAFVEKILASIPGYAAAFAKAFPESKNPVSYDNLAKAIGAFERRLVTPSRFDKFLAGDSSALTADEQKGLSTFISAGCTACHAGVGVGGGMYQKYGLAEPVPNLKDEGRAAFTKSPADKFFFKVPSLRNVARTAPYFHDGSVGTLDEAVKLMGKYQLGRVLSASEVTSIVAFLQSLTGELPASYIAPPKLPPSGKSTPKPDPT